MAMLTLAEILAPSVNKGWGVGAYDTANLATTYGILDAAEADKAPVIIMIYPAMISPEYYRTFAAFIKEEVKRRGVTASLILDHGPSLVEVEAALDAGFTGVMIDASSLPFDENAALSKKVVDMAHKVGVSVEAELGHVGLGTDVLPEDRRKELYTRIEDAKLFVEKTGVDALAVAIGTAHGVYKFEPHLDFERLAAIRKEIDIPLVLHGSSGTPEDQLVKAVSLGINKINVYSDIRVEVLKEVKPLMDTPIDSLDISNIDAATRNAAKKIVQTKNHLFGSVGKSNLYH